MTKDNIILTKDEFSKSLVKDFSAAVESVYQALIRQAVAAEREACENAVEDVARKYQKLHNASSENIADECADAIRARGTT